MFTLGIGVVLALVAVVNLGGAGIGSGSRLLALLGGLAAVALAIIDGSDVANRVASVSSAYVTGSVGMGIYVVGIGGIVAILVAIFGAKHASATT
jgi:microcompartment protein CcmL/EutN